MNTNETKYRHLKSGDIIQAGDEFKTSAGAEWRATMHGVGRKFDPALYHPHRRLIGSDTPETDAAWAKHRGTTPDCWIEFVNLASSLERRLAESERLREREQRERDELAQEIMTLYAAFGGEAGGV